AANNQGLEWGVEVDDRLEFSFDADWSITIMSVSTSYSVDHNVYLEIDSLPSIPNDVDSLSDIDMVVSTMKFANGTEVSDIFSEVPLSTGLPTAAYPIGNWAAVAAALDNDLTTATVTPDVANNATHFGYSYSMMGIDSAVYWYKADGSLAYMHMGMTITGMSDTQIHFVRTNPPDPVGGGLVLDTTTLLIIAGGVGVVIIIAIVFAKRR
ncbi:MAG: hypothetical protein RTU30_05820, partial [Candidatus Thorarchaeota archaeon]